MGRDRAMPRVRSGRIRQRGVQAQPPTCTQVKVVSILYLFFYRNWSLFIGNIHKASMALPFRKEHFFAASLEQFSNQLSNLLNIIGLNASFVF